VCWTSNVREEREAMNRREGLICYVLVFCTLIGALIVKAAESRSGTWTIT